MMQARGFTLIETALATIIVATGMLAMLAAHEAFVGQNVWGGRAAQAARLGSEIRERSMVLSIDDPVTGSMIWGAEEADIVDWDDMDDFDGLDVSGWQGDGPIDASGAVIPDMQQWRQVVRVESVDPTNHAVQQANGTTDAVRVSVDVLWHEEPSSPGELVTSLSWVHLR